MSKQGTAKGKHEQTIIWYPYMAEITTQRDKESPTRPAKFHFYGSRRKHRGRTRLPPAQHFTTPGGKKCPRYIPFFAFSSSTTHRPGEIFTRGSKDERGREREREENVSRLRRPRDSPTDKTPLIRLQGRARLWASVGGGSSEFILRRKEIRIQVREQGDIYEWGSVTLTIVWFTSTYRAPWRWVGILFFL